MGEPQDTATREGERILLVDDEPDILSALQDTLVAFFPEVDVSTAASGEEGLQQIRMKRVDLIITDYRMPGMDGIEFLGRARKEAPATPRILMTAYPDIDLALKALNQEKVIHMIIKPFQTEQVVDAVMEALDEQRRRRDRNAALIDALKGLRAKPTDPTG